jgi:molybdopterin-guanine dinucleotide biosynthesis protein A
MQKVDHHFSGFSADRGVVLLGEHCDKIHQWVGDISKALEPHRIGYLDAFHGAREKIDFCTLTSSLEGGTWHTPVHQDYWNIPLLASFNDLLFINGNHHSGKHQVLICNPEKFDSVVRRRESIHHVILILLTDKCMDVPIQFKNFPGVDTALCLHVKDIAGIASFFQRQFFHVPPALLILAGGRSTRMGMDKSLLDYHGVSQLEYLVAMANRLNMEAFVSVRDATQTVPPGAERITDVLSNLGPLGGICSAHLLWPQRSWWVVACDMPLMDESLIRELMSANSSEIDVLCFKSPESQLAEPLISFWKPRALRFAWLAIADGIRCPRKVIMQCNSLLVDCSRPEMLSNANTPEDLEKLRKKLAGKYGH